ncbi:MAG: phosphodiester glycosidase family protein [Verrucomicrobiae bacterium]|nr:phosphodiester glycosidase family protein [Verrucomicrobiae bacterium]
MISRKCRRMWWWMLAGGCLLVLAWPAGAARAARVQFLDKEFVCYWVDWRTDHLGLYWKDHNDKPLATFSRLREHVRPAELKFAINAGIFSRDLTPLGLHVEGGRQLRPLNLKSLEGGQYNFYLKPNGVFFLHPDTGPRVMASEEFARLAPPVHLACQSGPLLLTNGVFHPAFRPASTNFFLRSGVGVSRRGEVVFALSLHRLRFYDFARLFREKLECDEALYLDGEICAVYLPELGFKDDARAQFAAMWAVTVPVARTEQGTPAARP